MILKITNVKNLKSVKDADINPYELLIIQCVKCVILDYNNFIQFNITKLHCSKLYNMITIRDKSQ